MFYIFYKNHTVHLLMVAIIGASSIDCTLNSICFKMKIFAGQFNALHIRCFRLQSLKMHPVCHCLIRDDITFIWKLCNEAIDVHCKLPSSSLPTRSSLNGLFHAQSSRDEMTTFSPDQHVLLTSSYGRKSFPLTCPC